jgi:hypothetical protein
MTRQDARFSIALAVTLALTLGLKFATSGGALFPVHKQFADDVSAALVQQGYVTHILPRTRNSWLITASRGPCRIAMRAALGGIGLKQIHKAQMGAFGPVRYFVGGVERSAIPVWRVQAQELAQRAARKLGIAYALPPVIALAAAPGCSPDMLALSHIPMHYRHGSGE